MIFQESFFFIIFSTLSRSVPVPSHPVPPLFKEKIVKDLYIDRYATEA